LTKGFIEHQHTPTICKQCCSVRHEGIIFFSQQHNNLLTFIFGLFWVKHEKTHWLSFLCCCCTYYFVLLSVEMARTWPTQCIFEI